MKRGNSKRANKTVKMRSIRAPTVMAVMAVIIVLASILAATMTVIKLKEKERMSMTGINAQAESQQITGFVLYSGLAELQLSKAIVMAATIVFAATVIGVFVIKTREIRKLHLHKPKQKRNRK